MPFGADDQAEDAREVAATRNQIDNHVAGFHARERRELARMPPRIVGGVLAASRIAEGSGDSRGLIRLRRSAPDDRRRPSDKQDQTVRSHAVFLARTADPPE